MGNKSPALHYLRAVTSHPERRGFKKMTTSLEIYHELHIGPTAVFRDIVITQFLANYNGNWYVVVCSSRFTIVVMLWFCVLVVMTMMSRESLTGLQSGRL